MNRDSKRGNLSLGRSVVKLPIWKNLDYGISAFPEKATPNVIKKANTDREKSLR
jgi:hypothetical protein